MEFVEGFDDETSVTVTISNPTTLYNCGSLNCKEFMHNTNDSRDRSITKSFIISKGKGTVHLFFETIPIWLIALSPMIFHTIYFY